MPFTPVHAVAALPFRRTRLDMTAIVIGSLSPDFDYFVRLAPQGHFGHTLPGLFLADLPASLLVLWLYLRFLEPVAQAWFPGTFPHTPGSASDSRFAHPHGFAVAAVSILIGASTHLAWDSFTHIGYWPYKHLAWLRYVIHLPPFPGIRVFKVLQFGSTAVVAAVLLILWIKHARAVSSYTRRIQRPARRLLLTGIAIALTGACVRAFIGAGVPRTRHSAKLFLIEGLVTTMTLLWLEALIFHARLRLAAPV